MSTGPVVPAPSSHPRLEGLVSDAVEHLRGLGYRPGTLANYQRTWRRFLHFARGDGPATALSTDLVERFLKSCGIEPHQGTSRLSPSQRHRGTVMRVLSEFALHGCLRYLSLEGLVDANLVTHVPKVRLRNDQRIPSVWSGEQVSALLAAVDRSSPCGMRDYAILLLAARLGIRVGDIRALRFDHLSWEQGRIEIPQSKGGGPLSLPLTEEIGHALIDYLRHGRPVSPYREVFLRANAPFRPLGRDSNLRHIITTYRRRAGVQCSAARSSPKSACGPRRPSRDEPPSSPPHNG